MFKHPVNELFSYIDDYNVDKLVDDLYDSLHTISNIINCKIYTSEKYDINQDISSVELEKLIEVHIENKEKNLDAIYNVEIPSIINGVMTKDRSKFIQKQLRDILFVTDIKKGSLYTRVLPDIDIEIDTSLRENSYSFNVKDSSNGRLIPFYLYLLEENEENKLLDSKDEMTQKDLNQFLKLSKEELYKTSIINNSYGKFRQSILMLKILFKTSNIIKEYCSSVADILYQSYIRMINYDEDKKKEIGLNLESKRVRTVNEIIRSSILSQIIYNITYDLEVMSSTRRSNLNRRIEITKDLYDVIQIEQLESPYANLANKAKVTLSGKFSFSRENVPTRLKLLHDSEFNNLCPVATPDRDGTGVIMYLASSCKIDKLGRFLSYPLLEKNSKHISTEVISE